MNPTIRSSFCLCARACAGLIVLAVVAYSTGAEAGFSFVTIDPPGSSGRGTISIRINNNPDVAGSFTKNGDTLGFLTKDLGTTFQTFRVTRSTDTEVEGVNNKDQITGFVLGNNTSNCFLRKPSGGTLVCGPAGQESSVGFAINVHGVVTGDFQDQGQIPDHGFLWDNENGAVTFDAPGAFDTVPLSISDTGLVTGTWDDLNGGNHSFVRDAGGTIAEFDVPGAEITSANDINSFGVVVGHFLNNQTHSFIRDSTGNIIVFDPNGALSSEAVGINKRGLVVGSFADKHGFSHGFERLPSGKIKTFDVPGATDTFVDGINDNGIIVGAYADTEGFLHGYVGDFGP
jgi:hypothetical protein